MTDFLIELSIGLHKNAIYPPGHPLLEHTSSEIKRRLDILMKEREALSLAMHGDKNIVIPLLQLKEFDQYTTTHSLNVSVLTMALAEWMGMGAKEVRIPRMSSPTSTARPRSPTSITS